MNNTFQKYIMYIITYTYQNFNPIFNNLNDNLKYFSFFTGFSRFLTGLFFFNSKIFIRPYGWFISYFIFNVELFFIFFFNLKKKYFNLNYFILLFLPFPNIFFCNEIERNNNSTQIIENTNIHLIYIISIKQITPFKKLIYKNYIQF